MIEPRTRKGKTRKNVNRLDTRVKHDELLDALIVNNSPPHCQVFLNRFIDENPNQIQIGYTTLSIPVNKTVFLSALYFWYACPARYGYNTHEYPYTVDSV